MKHEYIKLKNVSRIFQMGEIKVVALDKVNLSIYDGEFIVILGASGSGKTTLLNQIGGIDKPTEGSVIIEGEDVTNYGDKEMTIHRREKVGWIFQFHNLIPSLTSVENVQLALEMMGESENQYERSVKVLKNVGLEDEVNRFPSQISGGQQQRVAIARALVKKPKIIVADEPTGNLDRKTGKKIVDLMVRLCKEEGITFVVVTHDPSLTKVADKLYFMEDGKVLEDVSESKVYSVVE